MQNIETRLFIFFDDNTVFSDFSNSAQDYSRDSFSLELSATQDFLYIGYRKPINTVYISMDVPVTTANTFTFEYFKDDGGGAPAFTAITKTQFLDESKGMTRSGFLSWERNLDDDTATTINGQEAFWYRLRPSVNHDAGTTVRGINIVLADDNDLKTVVPSILDSDRFIPEGEKSHILAHVAARDEIIQKMRNSGKFKVNFNTGEFKDFNSFDLLKIQQLREAAKWKALNVIFADLQDAADDVYSVRANLYQGRFNTAMATFFLNIDIDDDGIEDRFEELSADTPRIVRR